MTMAESNAGLATGADQNGYDLRRRNVPSQEGTNGSITKPPDTEDTKKTRKVRQQKRHTISIKSLTGCVQPQTSILAILDEYEFLIAPLIFTALAFFTRMYKIGLSPIVTWDEAQYVNRSFSSCYPSSIAILTYLHLTASGSLDLTI